MKNDGKKKIRKTDGPKKGGKTQKARVTRRRMKEQLSEAIREAGEGINLSPVRGHGGIFNRYIFSLGFRMGFEVGRKST